MALSLRAANYLTMAPRRWRSLARSWPQSPYEVLQVGEEASAAEIKAAYRTMAKRAHPDAATGVAPVAVPGAEEFLELRRAYETLSDPAVLARYDGSIGRLRVAPRAGRFGPARMWETEQCW